MIVLQTVLLSVHLLAMNVAAAGPLLCVAVQWIAYRSKSELHARIGLQLAGASLASIFLGIGAGLASGWVFWVGGAASYFSAVERLRPRVTNGVWELVFYAVCLTVYILWWRSWPPRRVVGQICLAMVGLAAGTNLLWHFPSLMTAIAHLAAGAVEGAVLAGADYRELIFRAEVTSRWLHVWLASFATAGLLLAWLADRAASKSTSIPHGGETPDAVPRSNGDDSAGPQATRPLVLGGARTALAATLLQLPVGMWLLLSSPAGEQSRLMGGDLLATCLFLAAMVTVLLLLHQLAAVAMGGAAPRSIPTAGLLLILTVLLMSAALILGRSDPTFGESPHSFAPCRSLTRLIHA